MKHLWIAVIFIIVPSCHCCQKAVVTPKKVDVPMTEASLKEAQPEDFPARSEEAFMDDKPSVEKIAPQQDSVVTRPTTEAPKIDKKEEKIEAQASEQTKVVEIMKQEAQEPNECDIIDTEEMGKNLVEQLSSKLFGQHLATSIVSKAVKSHIENPNSSKALVLSFHGSSGVGKSYTIKLIAEALFRNGQNSRFVHHIRLGSAQIETEKALEAFLISSLEECRRSLFILEVDHISSKILNFLHNFIDYYGQFNSQRAIFILVSKDGGNEINDIVLEASLTEEMRREDLRMEHFEKIITISAYNGKGGLSRSILIDRGLIDIFVPFLPLEKRHVMKCIEEHLTQLNKEKNIQKIERIAGSIQYFAGRFASTGCMKIMARSSLILDEEQPEEKRKVLEHIEDSEEEELQDKEDDDERDEL